MLPNREMQRTTTLAILCTAAFLTLSGSRSSAGPDLRSGAIRSALIQRGEGHRFRMAVPRLTTCEIRVLQHEIDIAVSAGRNDRKQVSDSKTLGTERLLLSAGQPEQIEIIVEASRSGTSRGFYTLSVRCRSSRPNDAEIQSAEDLLYEAVCADRQAEVGARRTAVSKLQVALEIFRRHEDRFGEVQALKWLGILNQKLGLFEEAAEVLKKADHLGDPADLDTAVVLRNLSTTASFMSDDNLEHTTRSRARALLLNSSDRRGAALAWYYDSIADRMEYRFDLAIVKAERSLAIAQPLGDHHLIASNLHSLAAASIQLAQFSKALRYATEVLDLRTAQNDLPGQAAGWGLIGEVLRASGRFGEASVPFRRALSMREAQGDFSAAAGIASVLGEIALKEGNDSEGRYWAGYAGRLEADLRRRMKRVSSRAGFSQRLLLPREQIQALMLRQNDPHSAAEAFLAADRAYGKNLLESSDGRLLSVNQLQRLLDSDTILLLYWLGRPSYVWALSSQQFQWAELASRDDIESLAAEYTGLVTARVSENPGESASSSRNRVQQADARTRRVASELSRTLFATILRSDRPKRLLVVSAGVLSEIPLDALPDPADPERPILARTEISLLPSATAILTQQQPASLAKKDLLILADDASALPFGPRELQGILPHFTSEQVTFASLDSQRSALGLAATHRIVHINGHGIVNNSDPDKSAIEIPSLAAENAQISVGDVRRLKLSNDLVILNACQTSSGRPYNAESVISLANTFLQAGAAQVMATLWKVDDEASAELMKHFYRALRVNGRSPSVALREARVAIGSVPRWSAHYYWAGYQMHGAGRSQWK